MADRCLHVTLIWNTIDCCV